eukprot:scaffold2072_cov126-Isochrysis_galbana.AAC.20
MMASAFLPLQGWSFSQSHNSGCCSTRLDGRWRSQHPVGRFRSSRVYRRNATREDRRTRGYAPGPIPPQPTLRASACAPSPAPGLQPSADAPDGGWPPTLSRCAGRWVAPHRLDPAAAQARAAVPRSGRRRSRPAPMPRGPGRPHTTHGGAGPRPTASRLG